MKANTVLDTIGSTPHIRMQRLFGPGHEVWIKSERSNPGGSIKDRIALSMVEAAERDGRLRTGGTIIEPTSGNTGVGLAMVAAVKGYKLVLVIARQHERGAPPPDAGLRRELRAHAARAGHEGRDRQGPGADRRDGPVRGCRSSSTTRPTSDVHVRTTAQEILADFPQGLDALITGVGTGGHITGCAQVLKAQWPQLKVFAVEPSASPVISGGKPSPHPIQGIGAGFLPTNLHTALLDGVIQVEAEAAREMARRSLVRPRGARGQRERPPAGAQPRRHPQADIAAADDQQHGPARTRRPGGTRGDHVRSLCGRQPGLEGRIGAQCKSPIAHRRCGATTA